jgi:hypothetical protein
VSLFLGAAALSGCSSDFKKLSSGGSAADVLMYDILGADRGAQYYYDLVRDSHDEQDFCYECGTDPYLVDKNIDAIHRLGDATYGRLEGQAQVVELMVELLLEDRSALARSAAATSLTKMAVRWPPYPSTPIPDEGERFLSLAPELARLYERGGGRSVSAADRPRALAVLRDLGDLDFDDLSMEKKALKEFYGRPYLIGEQDPALRTAIDTALVKRSRAVSLSVLRAAVEDSEPQVRADAVRGLKTIGDASAEAAVVDRLGREPSWLVQMEIVEYLGRIGTEGAAAALLPRLDDPNSSVRWKARESLVSMAGRDLGHRRGAWEAWARRTWPGIDLPAPSGRPSPESEGDLAARRGP